ncbi:PQQ-dependent sugar dehydrogenase [Streptomyces canus]|uniref:PQQ-dependent sugar dehydrogenase n=1 Tax=Streptomyces canus TaxID=58343 RepID=UPI0039A5E399
MTFLPDGSALVSERIAGEILRVPARGGDATFVGVVPDVDVSSEGGLLGIVASSTFNDDRTVFASVSGGRGEQHRRADDRGRLRLARRRPCPARRYPDSGPPPWWPPRDRPRRNAVDRHRR